LPKAITDGKNTIEGVGRKAEISGVPPTKGLPEEIPAFLRE
jgi:hypothetical protein